MDPIQSDLYQEINRKFHSSGIRIPFPQHDLHVQMVEKSTSAA
jgi:small-conductance mechanosensitive channel